MMKNHATIKPLGQINMKLPLKLILSGATVVSVLMITAANADTNGLVFPSGDVLNGVNSAGRGIIYPPQQPSQPSMNGMPQVPSYNFSRSSPQQFKVPPVANQFRRGAPSNGAYPSQTRPMQRAMPSMMPRTMPRMPQSAPRQVYPTQQNRSQRPQRYPSYPQPRRNNNSLPFSNNMMPFGNSGNNSFPFSGGNMPFGNGNMPFSNGSSPFGNNGNSFGMPSNPMNNMFGNKRNGSMPFFNQGNKKRKKAWGKERNIWPDFYTDFTDEGWDTMMSGPRDLGTMPGGWRFPYLSTPDPVTVTDAIVNQFPPIAEEAGNMADFSDWGVFDNK